MISSPQPNKATANSDSNEQHIPPPTLPNLASTNGHSDSTTNAMPSQLISPQMERRAAQVLTQGGRRNWWQRLSLRTKATGLAIALGVLPVFAIGTTSYFLFNKDLGENTIQDQETFATSLGDEIGRFMFERYGDIQAIANLPILRNSKVRSITTLQQKQAVLTSYVEIHGVYSSIAAFDLNGNVIVQSAGKALSNHKDRDYFQQVIKTRKPFFSQPETSKTTGEIVIYTAAPIVDTQTGKMIGVVRSRMPVKHLDKILDTQEQNLSKARQGQEEYHLISGDGKFFAATEKDQVGRDARADFAGFTQMQAAKKVASAISIEKIDGAEQLISYAPIAQFKGMPELNWSILLAENTAQAFAVQRRLLLTLLFGTGVTALIVGAIAAYLADRATRPILRAADAVDKLGQGKLDTRIPVTGEDELAKLGSNFNHLGEQLQTLLVEQQEATRQQFAAQAEAARQQAENTEQQRLAKETLQRRALELLMEVDPLSKGDLTIRASVTDDEIGTVADSYNSTINSLRKIVTQVQTVAQQVTATTSKSEVSVQDLSTEALRQTEEIAAALDRLEEMSDSIRAVAVNAEQAEAAVQQATQTVEAGDAAMNRTVDGMIAIQTTVVETSQKVKRLGESSQKISKVVNLIGRFAAQTNLLALKASIEAARAGEEGRGFAVLADEVRTLASQSAQATSEIESLVTAIQTETNEVVAAMEAGTEQVAEGTKLVDETKQSLNQINAVSVQISELVQAIAQSAVAQSQASEEVTETMTGVAAIANQTSTGATQVSASFRELLAVAQQLQASAGQFKVN